MPHDDDDEDAGERPQVGPADTKRQFRLTALERGDVSRAIMERLARLGAGEAVPRDEHESWRLTQLLDRFCD